MKNSDSKKKKPTGKKRRGTPRKQSRGSRLISASEQAYGYPTRLSRKDDLSDRDILDGIVADAGGDGWHVNGKRLPAPSRSPAELQPSLIRDIHLFVCSVIRTKKKTSSIPAYHLASNGGYSETVIGAEYSKIESALRAGLPTEQRRYSEHVRLFLVGYQAFGLDGGIGDQNVIAEHAGDSHQQRAVVNGFIEWIRKKCVERIDKPKPRMIYPAYYPIFPAEKSSVKVKAKKGRNRNVASGRFEVSGGPMVWVPGAIPVFPSVNDRVVDDSFQARLRRRRINPTQNNRKAAELVERLFQRVEAVRVIHLDVGLRPEYAGEPRTKAAKAVKDFLKVYFNYGVKNIGPFRGMVGRIAKLAHTRDRGYFCRIMFIFESSAKSNFVGIADRLGSYWAETATGGRGVYSTVGPGASRFRVEPKGAIRRFDPQARVALLRAVRYLTVTDEYLRPDLPDREISFFASDLPLWRDPPATRRGNDTIQDYAYKPSESASASTKSADSGKPPEVAASPDAPSAPHSATDAEADRGAAGMHESGSSAATEAEKARSEQPMVFENDPQRPADDSPD